MPMRSTLEVGTTRRCLAVLLSALLTSGSLTPAVAWAQAKPATTKSTKAAKADEEAKRQAARQHYSAGEEALKAGDFAAAHREYKAANDLLPAPITMFKMAFCHDKLEQVAEAIASYEAFLAANPPGTSAERVAEAEGRITELKKKLPATVALRTDPAGAVIEVDGVAHDGVTPIDLKVSPGRHTLRLTLSGYETLEQELNAAPGASEEVSITLVPSPAPLAQAEPEPSTDAAPIAKEASTAEKSNLVPYVLLGLAGAGVVVGGVFGVKAMQSKSEFDKGDKTPAKADEIDRSALVADMAFGAALTFGVTGLVLLLANDGPAEVTAAKSGSIQVSPYVSPQGAGAGAFMRF